MIEALAPWPAVGDAVVLEGIKYRVVSSSTESLRLAPAGPTWRKAREAIRRDADPRGLMFDRIAGLWRELEPLGGWEPRS